MILNISKHIYTVLTADPTVSGLIGDRIYPLGTKVETALPFVVYERNTVTPTYSKDGMASARSYCSILCAGETFQSSLDLANAVIDALDGVTASYDGFDVTRAAVSSAGENYVQGAYIQEVEFNYTIISTEQNG